MVLNNLKRYKNMGWIKPGTYRRLISYWLWNYGQCTVYRRDVEMEMYNPAEKWTMQGA